MNMMVAVFPGQGSQYVGMASDLYNQFPYVKILFDEVSDVIKRDLWHIISRGPDELLQYTQNTQPALMSVSIAALMVLEKEYGFDLSSEVNFVAGHSLGEYTALVATRSLTLRDGAYLLSERGKAMQEAIFPGKGKMAAILGLDLARVQDILEQLHYNNEICVCANDNADGQVVISGHRKIVEEAVILAKSMGAKRSVVLPVSAPFHSPIMKSAEEKMVEILSVIDVSVPSVPIISNVTARPTSDPHIIRTNLNKQICHVVRWRETMYYLIENGIDRFIEIGAGSVLTNLMRRTKRDVQAMSILSLESMKNFLRNL